MLNLVHGTSSLEKSFSGGSIAEMRMRLLRAVLVTAILVLLGQAAFADVVEQGVKDSKPSGLLAGVANININPAVGIPNMNWGSASYIVANGIDPVGMFLRALVLSDGKQKFALVDVDEGFSVQVEWDAVAYQVKDEAIKRASELTGIPVEHIRLGSTHTHSTPTIRPDLARDLLINLRPKGSVEAELSQYMEMLKRHEAVVADKLVGVIVEANSKLRPVHAFGMTGTGSINISRRFRAQGDKMPWAAVGYNPEGFVDHELPVIRIDDAQGNPYAILVNFQCHGTVLSFENQLISPDWPGHMRYAVEKNLPGATCLFFQGAAGNQGPIEGYTGDLEVVRRLGTILGLEATALAMRISTVRREPQFEGYIESLALQANQRYRVLGPHDATLKYASKILELPRQTFTKEDIDKMAKRTADAEKNLNAVKQAAGSSQWDINQATARYRRWAGLLARYKRPDAPPVKLEIAVLRIGDMALLLTNGELFAEIGAAVKKGSPFKVTMFCGYGNRAGDGYMPIKSEYPLGGYEVEGSYNPGYNPGAAETVIEEAIALLKSVR